MLDPGNAAALSKTGRVFCLVATPDEILRRVSQDEHIRPLLQVADPLESIVELLQQRKEGYGQFPQFITSEKDPDAVARDLASINSGDNDVRLPITASDARYEFIVGGGVLPFVSQLAGIRGPIAVITDTNVGPLYAHSCGDVDITITVSPGRQHKTIATAQSIFEQLLKEGFDRSGTILALGGTVISELAGFVAATYMRGIDCVQCPTSLLAMVDTCIGGKVGVDLAQSKNLVGAFKQPKAVIADVATLSSLSPKAFASGMAEVIKHSLIADSDLLEKIEARNWKSDTGFLRPPLGDLQSLVAQSIQVKVNIVQEDPFDKGRRGVLNLGHTFANAIEQISGHTISHGEAVAMGLVAAANLSVRLGHCSDKLQNRIEMVLADATLPTAIPGDFDPEKLIRLMRGDKKKASGRLRFVLMRDVGDVFIADDISDLSVVETLRAVQG